MKTKTKTTQKKYLPQEDLRIKKRKQLAMKMKMKIMKKTNV